MALSNQFVRKLDDLWHTRTANIRSLVTPRRGPPRKFSKEFRENCIYELQELATKILLRSGVKREFRKVMLFSKMNRIGSLESREADRLLVWAKSLGKDPTIFSFWKGKKCLYVGQAANFVARLNHYIGAKSKYLNSGNTIKIFVLKRRSQLGQAECLAIHLLNPIENKVKAAHQAWGKSCRICEFHDFIRDELQSLFRMR